MSSTVIAVFSAMYLIASCRDQLWKNGWQKLNLKRVLFVLFWPLLFTEYVAKTTLSNWQPKQEMNSQTAISLTAGDLIPNLPLHKPDFYYTEFSDWPKFFLSFFLLVPLESSSEKEKISSAWKIPSSVNQAHRSLSWFSFTFWKGFSWSFWSSIGRTTLYCVLCN